jgi:hypothetical protein
MRFPPPEDKWLGPERHNPLTPPPESFSPHDQTRMAPAVAQQQPSGEMSAPMKDSENVWRL